MHISEGVFQAAASSQLGRLELRSDSGSQTCVCNKSFSGWVVHVIRYRFSKNYREQEQETRRQILIAALGSGDGTFTLSEVQQRSLLDRKKFNHYIHTELKRLAKIETTVRVEPNVISPATSVQNLQTDEILPQAMNEEPAPDQEPSTISPDTSVQDTQTDETSSQAPNEGPAPDQEPRTIPPDTSVQDTQTDETSSQATSEEPAPVQKPGTASVKGTGDGKIQPEPKKRAQKSLYRPTASTQSKIVRKKTGSEAGRKLQPPFTNKNKLNQSRTKPAGSTEKVTPKTSPPRETASKSKRAPLNQVKTATPKPTTGNPGASARPTAEEIIVNYEDTMSESDNVAWIRKRNLWAKDYFESRHAAAVFYVGDDKGPINTDFRISEKSDRCVHTVATLEKRIGERLNQYGSNANANTKHFLTFLTLRNERVPTERDRLFKIEYMKKSLLKPGATWKDNFMNGGMLGVPDTATKCGRRLPTEDLMFCANKIISALPVDKKTGVFQGYKESDGGRVIGGMYDKAADPEYRKDFSPDGQELTPEDFEWLLMTAASFGEYCNGEGY